jgi:tripartite-type tricarboxylate transporter receptor subunit TctC
MSRVITAVMAGALGAAALAGAGIVHGQSYPAKPVRFIIGFSPGGPSDILTRLVGTKLSEVMGQPFVFENRPGAGGNIAGDAAAKSPPDGYTLLMGNNSILATNAALYKNMPFDPVKDLDPVSLIAAQPNILVVHPSVPAKNVKELIALAKARPGELNYASSGSGAAAHLAAELFKSMTGTQMAHIPYKGAAPALADVLAGQCQLIFATSLSVQPHIRSGRLRPLAVTTAKRARANPELPTIAEAGVPGFEANTWHGIVVPARTPQPIVARLNTEINRVLQLPDVRERIEGLGGEILGGTPQQFAAYVQKEIPKWTKVVRESGAKAE